MYLVKKIDTHHNAAIKMSIGVNERRNDAAKGGYSSNSSEPIHQSPTLIGKGVNMSCAVQMAPTTASFLVAPSLLA